MTGARVTVFSAIAKAEARRISTPRRIEVANVAAAEAIARAPVETGEYRNGIHVVVSGDDVSLVDDDETAVHKEYGTLDTPAHAVLTDAVRKHGKYTGMQPRASRRR